MQASVLITNGGKHSDETLAAAAADQIISIGATASGEQAIQARRLQNSIIDILASHHGVVSDREVDLLDRNGHEHLSAPTDIDANISSATVDILREVDASPFAAWFADPTRRSAVRDVIGTWLATNVHVHRDWRARGYVGRGRDMRPADGHDPNNEHVVAWAARNGHQAA